MEPLVAREKLQRYKRMLGCSQAFSNINNKIWIFGDEDLDCTVIDDQEQVLTCSISVKNEEEFIISAVYAKTKSALRLPLWEDLKRLSYYNKPWCVTGDFNCITEAQEKEGGLPHNHQKALPFINCILQCDLVDLQFSGPKYTRCNDWAPDRRIWKRLDRALVNHLWATKYSNSSVMHLHRVNSDHAPLAQNCYC